MKDSRSAISVASPRPFKPRRPLAPAIRVPRQKIQRRHSTKIPINQGIYREAARETPRWPFFVSGLETMITRHEPLHERYRRLADTILVGLGTSEPKRL